MPSVFRIHRTEEIRAFGERPFGVRKHWESHSCAELMGQMKKKFGMATHIYCDHIGFAAENKGYIGGFNQYYTYSPERVNQGDDKPYPTIDERTNIPLEINHPGDRDEHQKRLDYWGLETGIQSAGETKRKWKQRYELGQYAAGKGGKWADLGCGSEKCHEDEIGVDIFPYPCVDIVHDTTDLWFFKNEELDGITACHHLEHLADTKKALREWDRVLKPEGILAFIVPDGLLRPNTIREPSHKVCFTMDILKHLIYRVLGYKILRLEAVPNIEPRKASIICVAQKRAIENVPEVIIDDGEQETTEIID
jgi:SAM-dependent methyltransferase